MHIEYINYLEKTEEKIMALKDFGKNILDSAKTMAEDKINEIKETKEAEKELKSIFKPNKKISNLQIDSVNKLFRIKNASAEAYKKKDGFAKKALTISTFGTSKLVEKAISTGDKIYSFSELIDFELLEDDISIASGGLGRAFVGGVAFGGVGAIVGAATGKKTTKKQITQLILKININNLETPCIMIPYIISPTKTTSKEYKEAFNTSHQVMSALNVITNQKENSQEEQENETINTDIIDEFETIKKLKELLDMGIISDQEFETKKKEILNL